MQNLGNKNAIEKERDETDSKIEILKVKNQLSAEELKQYQEISEKISRRVERSKNIDDELSRLSDVSPEKGFFSAFKITPSPALTSLPKTLQESVRELLKNTEAEVLETLNKQVADYKLLIGTESAEIQGEIGKLRNEHKELIGKIETKEAEKVQTIGQLAECATLIAAAIQERRTVIEELIPKMKNTEQRSLRSIKFDVEYGFDETLEEVTERINVKERTAFVEKGSLNLDHIRQKPGEFLDAIHSKTQKVIAHNDSKEVARDILLITEKILFTAEMESDRIGGFSESTMTPGKRALFALRLILAESDDTWPLLVDQPEDDLDSRSIYDEVVPFLKEKKKERQIIMVSHNANLVIGSDSEQVIIANRNGNDRKNEDGKQFNYLTGSLENTKRKDRACRDTLKSQGICEHACEILDGGRIAFENRKNKYNIR